MPYPWFKPLNLSKQYKKNINQVIDLNKMTMGTKCELLENELKKILNFKHIILTTSGTSALMLAALSLNIKKNDLTYITNYTWIASINPFIICGSKVQTFDTAKDSFTVDYKILNSQIRIKKPKIVVLVNLNGESFIDKDFLELKKKLNFIVVEDCAQSLFVKNNLNKYSGTNSDIACYSLSITKLFHMIYGGFCATNNDDLARRMRMVRNNGVNSEPENAKLELAQIPGLNMKPNDLSASIGIINLKNKKRIISKSNKIYETYTSNLKNHKIKIIKHKKNINSISVYISVIVDNRDEFSKYCNKNNICIHYALRTLSESKIINLNNKSKFKNSTLLSNKLVRLPSGPGYNIKDILKICKILNKY